KLEKYYENMFAGFTIGKNYGLPAKEIKRLKNTLAFEAFYKVCRNLPEEERLSIWGENKEQMIALVRSIKFPILRAYCGHIIKEMKLKKICDGYDELMLELLQTPTVYARENALKAIYSFGKPELVRQAFLQLSERKMPHNDKLILDGMLSFTGDERELAATLMEVFDDLLDCYRNSLIDYLGQKHIDTYDERLMCMADLPVDTLCDILRKLERSPSERNLLFLESTIKAYRHTDTWEPVAISVKGLGGYPGNERVRGILMDLLLSRNWYIRKNAAAALVADGITEQEIEQIHSKNDRYADDALQYELGRRPAHV
ncbi:MAG: hypothetical protein K6E18_11020, partial [Lachnospiraceae bacterium]|nr:hypothetical protein [Lachnospiraceae bacterium]